MANAVPFAYANAMLILRLNWFPPQFDLQQKKNSLRIDEKSSNSKKSKPKEKKNLSLGLCHAVLFFERFCHVQFLMITHSLPGLDNAWTAWKEPQKTNKNDKKKKNWRINWSDRSTERNIVAKRNAFPAKPAQFNTANRVSHIFSFFFFYSPVNWLSITVVCRIQCLCPRRVLFLRYGRM